MTSIAELLKSEHAEVTSQFDQYTQAQNETEKQRLAREITKALTAHATAEEELFYPEARNAVPSSALIDQALQQHTQAKALITQIEANIGNSAQRDAMLQQLRAAVQQHVQFEESQIIPTVESSNIDLDTLGTKFEERKNELMA